MRRLWWRLQTRIPVLDHSCCAHWSAKPFATILYYSYHFLTYVACSNIHNAVAHTSKSAVGAQRRPRRGLSAPPAGASLCHAVQADFTYLPAQVARSRRPSRRASRALRRRRRQRRQRRQEHPCAPTLPWPRHRLRRGGHGPALLRAGPDRRSLPGGPRWCLVSPMCSTGWTRPHARMQKDVPSAAARRRLRAFVVDLRYKEGIIYSPWVHTQVQWHVAPIYTQVHAWTLHCPIACVSARIWTVDVLPSYIDSMRPCRGHYIL